MNDINYRAAYMTYHLPLPVVWSDLEPVPVADVVVFRSHFLVPGDSKLHMSASKLQLLGSLSKTTTKYN